MDAEPEITALRDTLNSVRPVSSLRWLAVSVFILSSTLNYLDRALLATFAPLIMQEFHFNQTRFGLLLSVFSIAYAFSSIAAGWFLDRAGINRGISVAVAWWSAAAACTGFVTGFNGLQLCRAALGIGEAAGVPAVGKLNGIYLQPRERALGAALNQVGLSLGLSIAPAFIGMALVRSWRAPFVLMGLLGFVWIPVWLVVSRMIPPAEPALAAPQSANLKLLLDRDLLILTLANVLWMGAYSLWSNWTTIYLTKVHGLSLKQTAAYVWIPPLISNVGGFFGGWMSLRWMSRGVRAVPARRRAVVLSAVGMLSTLLLPAMPDARWATAVISMSFFFALAGSVNIYALPIDIFGPERSGLAIASLGFAFGLMQTVVSPIIGYLGDHKLYTEVVWLVAIPPLAACGVLQSLRKR